MTSSNPNKKYKSEAETISDLLKSVLKTEINPTLEEWDRLFSLDYYIVTTHQNILR
jgi:hypothetical protein